MAHTPKNQSEKAILTARRAWCYLVLVLISFLCLFFFYVLIINSTRTHFEIQKGFSLMPGKSIITNFRNVLTDANIPVVSGIRNRAGTGWCPVGALCASLTDIGGMVEALGRFLAAQQKSSSHAVITETTNTQ